MKIFNIRTTINFGVGGWKSGLCRCPQVSAFNRFQCMGKSLTNSPNFTGGTVNIVRSQLVLLRAVYSRV